MHAELHLEAATSRLFSRLLIGSMLLAMVPTIWTALDFGAAALFLGPSASLRAVDWAWVQAINLYIPAVFRIWVLICMSLWLLSRWVPTLKRQRQTLAFVVLAGALGPGLVVNSGFKDNWKRARPYQVSYFGGPQEFSRAGVMANQCDNNCSFVSGHVACGSFLMSMMLVHPRRRKVWAVVGGFSTGLIGFARMADGAHWLSDTLWAVPITLFTSWMVWQVLRWRARRTT